MTERSVSQGEDKIFKNAALYHSIHVIVEYNQAGSEIICRQIIVEVGQVLGTHCFRNSIATPCRKLWPLPKFVLMQLVNIDSKWIMTSKFYFLFFFRCTKKHLRHKPGYLHVRNTTEIPITYHCRLECWHQAFQTLNDRAIFNSALFIPNPVMPIPLGLHLWVQPSVTIENAWGILKYLTLKSSK